ncbi:MAG: AAA family ATPase [Longimicrobiales bacterium]
MRLESARVRLFRNVVDSGEVVIDDAVTCFVGKNESGKTAFLHALQRLNPARGSAAFSVPDQYPAWLEKRDRMRGEELEEVTPVSAVFSLQPAEVEALEERFGKGCIVDPSQIVISRTYGNELKVQMAVSEEAFVTHLISRVDWPRGTKTAVNKVTSVEELRDHVQALKAESEPTADPDRIRVADAVLKLLQEELGSGLLSQAVWTAAEGYVPKFLYFSEYSRLPYSVDIIRVLTTAKLDDSELTARSLLRLAAAEDAYLKNPDYERRKRELENVANAITADVLKYWTQNPDLRVQPDITQKTVTDQQGRHSVLDELKIRIWDDRHLLSLPFSEHSTGFQWFFSFLAAFSEYEYTDDSLVILLDEPALGLHARAQADFLRFIDERLAPKRQVLYTTHSPFMVQPGELSRVRLVEDKGQELGSVVSSDVTSTDPDTLFPLQGALGYDLVQHLFIAPHNLVVEGTSDFTYLTTLSAHLQVLGRVGLDNRWSVVPVGGVDLVPTFVALLGNHLDLTVLVDGKKGAHQRLNRMVATGLLAKKRIITAGEMLQSQDGDIEDLFSESDYLTFLNPALGTTLSLSDLSGTDPIVRRVARALGVERFDHGKPADHFLRNRDRILPALTPETLDRFERLFERVNATMPA